MESPTSQYPPRSNAANASRNLPSQNTSPTALPTEHTLYTLDGLRYAHPSYSIKGIQVVVRELNARRGRGKEPIGEEVLEQGREEGEGTGEEV